MLRKLFRSFSATKIHYNTKVAKIYFLYFIFLIFIAGRILTPGVEVINEEQGFLPLG
jgi:hypothetical protein